MPASPTSAPWGTSTTTSSLGGPQTVDDLASLRFIGENRPVVFLGQPGCGKTHLAVAFAHGGRGRLPGLLLDRRRHGPAPPGGQPGGDLRHQAAGLHRTAVLVIDDVGLLPIDAEGAGVFFHVVNTRYQNGHPRWSRPIGACRPGATSSATPLSQGPPRSLMHRAVVFNIKGPSWRLREHAALAEASKA